MLLDVLFEHDFLPTYAFPREVRSFVIDKWVQGASGKWRIGIEQRPQQSVDIALSEDTWARIDRRQSYLSRRWYLRRSVSRRYPGYTRLFSVSAFLQYFLTLYELWVHFADRNEKVQRSV